MTLVGAGPGDPDLLTVRAARLLASADVVVADRLVPKQVLAMAGGEVFISGKTYGTADAAQLTMDELVVREARRGRSVIRLKGGDPFVFGRGGEEILEYAKHGVTGVKVVPGVSSAFAAPEIAGIPLTMRGVADRFIVCTATGRDNTSPDLPAFSANTTIIFLMGARRLESLCSGMIELGYPADWPIAAVCEATHEKQRTVRGTLSTLPADGAGIVKAPCTIIVGGVVNVLPPATGSLF